MFERDIDNVFASARNMLVEKFQPKVRELILSDQDVHSAEEFISFDKDALETLIDRESNKITLEER